MPGGPLVVDEIRAERATVKWKKPDDWEGSDITGYVLEKMDMVKFYTLIEMCIRFNFMNI